ncbi:MAG: hypothetical protein HRT61_23650, partial [Ekhidna sp.]|nr:hypothetical protein [Ekhidna sp.]
GQVFPARSLYDVLAPTHHTATGQPVIQVKNQKTGHVLTLPTHNPENYRLYEKDTLSIQKGNLIKPTINLTTTTRTKANTGTMYRCEGFTPHGDIKLDNGKVLSKNSLFLDHSVAVTAHGSQGRTVQDSYVSFAEDSFPAVTAKSYYVAISRSRERIKLFTSSKTELQRHIQKTGDRIHASEVKEHHEQRVLAQQQRVHHQSLTKAKEAYAKTFSRGVHQPSQSVQPKPHDYERGRG